MPHLDYTTFPGQIFWLAVCFITLFILVIKVILPRVGGVIIARETYVAKNLNQAEALRASAEEAEKSYSAVLHQASEDARGAIAKAADSAAKQLESKKAELAIKLEKKLKESEKKISAIENESDAVIERISRDLSSLMVKKVLAA